MLIMKDPEMGTSPGNYRPKTCLPVIWKMLTRIISEEVYQYLDREDLLPEEQKGCRSGSWGTNDQLFIDKDVLRESKARNKNLAMCWIDYKKAFDMVPHSWILECLAMFGVAENIRVLLAITMKSWQTVLTSNGVNLGEVNIKRGIFQGDSLSPLPFVIALIPLTLILRKATAGYHFTDKTKVNHLLFMDDLKLYGKDKAQLESLTQTVRIFSHDIGMQFRELKNVQS